MTASTGRECLLRQPGGFEGGVKKRGGPPDRGTELTLPSGGLATRVLPTPASEREQTGYQPTFSCATAYSDRRAASRASSKVSY